MTNPQRYHGLFDRLYAWSVARIFDVLNFASSWYAGYSLLQYLYHEIRAIRCPVVDIDAKTNRFTDVGLLQNYGRLLFRLEVALVYTRSCRTEMYAILLDDHAEVSRLSKIVFYKEVYAANRNHGQSEIDGFESCLTTICHTHVSTRSVLAKCDEPVNWSDHGEILRSIAVNLGISQADEKVKPGKLWQQIGFQGDDPCTDFRSTGLLGLHHLDYFSAHHPLYVLHMVEESGTMASLEDQVACYPFALCSIHVTKFLCDLINTGCLQRHLLQAELTGTNGIQDFTDALFSFLFVRCHLDWAEGVDKGEITSILQFEAFFTEYRQFIESELKTKVWENTDFHPQRTWW